MAGTSDAIKVDSDNMLLPKRQKEINELLDLLQKYRPTKIFIESAPSRQTYWDSLYVLSEKGLLSNDVMVSSESYQLGTKLAQRLKLPKMVVCVDWQLFDSTNNSAFDNLYVDYGKAIIKQYGALESNLNAMYTDNARLVIAEIKKINDVVAKLPVKEALLMLNSPEIQKKYYYANNIMLMDKNAYDYGVTSANLNMTRNLQIYSNIISSITISDQRVMIIYGTGHTEALRHMFEGNPQIKLTSFAEVIK
ncbi:DUF5694 domain-containing protein [Spirosoma arcticum]